MSLAPVTTGFSQLDELLGGGLQRSDMVILAARPEPRQEHARASTWRGRRPRTGILASGVFSLEMSAEQIAVRLISGEADVDSHRLRIRLFSDLELTRILDAIGLLSELPIYIDDTPMQGIVEMRGKSRRLQAERGLDLLVVDYLQLMSTASGRSDNRVQEMGEFSRSLKGMARDLDIPVVACSQLSRAPEQRPSHRPILSDLRESGSIEQDADVVTFIYREDKYTSREDWERTHPTDPYPDSVAEIIVAKHRKGPTGTVPLYFRDDVVRFENLDQAVAAPELA